jgi:hypothetical protein
MPLQDVQVTINVAYPAPRIGLGRPAIFVQKVGVATYKEYTTLAALTLDYAIGTPAYQKAEAVFAQNDRPDVVAVATYDTAIETSLAEFYNRAWHFALVAGDVGVEQDAAALFFNEQEFKLLAVQVQDDVGREAVKGMKRVIAFNHDVVGEHLDAAAVGALGSLPVGSITWKFKELKGITATYPTQSELDAIELDNAIAYVMKAGKGQLSEGKLANGEYIDVIHGQDWIKADMENEVQYTLSRAAKLPYDARGIGALQAAATTALQRGFNNGIIGLTADGLPDFTITALTREESDVQDRNDRIYRGLAFDFSLAGAIHSVRINGQIRV